MTEENMNKAIGKIGKNYEQLEQSLVNQLRLELSNHNYTIGTYRERVWQSLFEMMIPKKYCIEQGVFIMDSYGRISKEVDLAVFDEMYTPYIFNYGEIKFIPIEAVAVVIQCKSKIHGKSNNENSNLIQEETGKHQETMSENLENWVNSIEDLKTSLDSVTRTITELVDGYDLNLLKKERQDNLTQTSTRPIRILCATGIDEAMKKELDKTFDILLYVEDVLKSADEGKERSRLVKEIADEKNNFVEWNNMLNHWDHEWYEMRDEKYAEYLKKRQKVVLKSAESLAGRTLSDLRVTGKNGEENTILSLTFQLNQLLMFLNNPMLFPHRAYAKMFTRILGGEACKEENQNSPLAKNSHFALKNRED